AVLLPATLVASCCLQVAFGFSADPDFGPGRRDREHTDSVERLPVTQGSAVGVLVGKALAALASPDARLRVADVSEGDLLCGIGRVRYAAASSRVACHHPHFGWNSVMELLTGPASGSSRAS